MQLRRLSWRALALKACSRPAHEPVDLVGLRLRSHQGRRNLIVGSATTKWRSQEKCQPAYTHHSRPCDGQVLKDSSISRKGRLSPSTTVPFSSTHLIVRSFRAFVHSCVDEATATGGTATGATVPIRLHKTRRRPLLVLAVLLLLLRLMVQVVRGQLLERNGRGPPQHRRLHLLQLVPRLVDTLMAAALLVP